ncbi:MFS transporter [uncultured Secundilactobacillus sp.]|uniref:MFS transporter n=1 Tax=uncultured Secundilactobacillus sp. TaxID=2813935 RepID=UPI002584D8EF|nr:MFS transporter [uncultured Secundilactobacillus sp.]
MEQTVTRKTQLSILAAGLLAFIGILVETSMNVTFPTLIAEFHEKLATVQWLTTGYLLLVTLVMGTTAYAIKRFDARTIFRTAIFMVLIGTLLCAAAPNFWVLLIGRLAQAFATGFATPLMFHLIMSSVPEHRLGVYVGIASMIISFAPALGPTYGGVMNQLLSWRAIFWWALPLIVLVALLGERTITIKASHKNGAFDFGGLGLMTVIFASLVWAFNQAGLHGFTSSQFGLWLAIAIVAILLQIYHARTGHRQLLDWRILKRPIIRLQLINYFFFQFINIGISFVIPIFAENVLGANSLTAGMILFPGALLGACLGPVAGTVYDHKGLPLPLLFANGFVLLSVSLFTIFTDQLNAGLLAIFFVLLRLGFNFGFGNLMSDASTHVSLENKADQNSLFSMMQQYAGSIGTGVLAAVISSQERHHDNIAAATLAGGHIDFMILIGLALIAAIAGVTAMGKINKSVSQGG